MIPARTRIKRGVIALSLTLLAASHAGDPRRVYVVPNFHPASCGWLADWSTERNYCANSYFDHLDRVRDDANFNFALSECNNLIAMLNFRPDRAAELRQRIREGRVELCNAFFLEPTVNLSGGEALVKCGVEGLRWQEAVMGVRPRMAWMIDVTGTHEQMGQITAGLGLAALVYCRHTPTGYALHWIESPDGTRVLAVSPGHYNEWVTVFRNTSPLDPKALQTLADDLAFRADPTPLSVEEIHGRELTGRTPVIFLLNTSSAYRGYPNAWLSGRGVHRLEYALLAHEGAWETARIPQMAWEFNVPPVAVSGCAATPPRSFLRTSDNVIVEAMRREEGEIELRCAECLGRAGQAVVTVDLPHRGAVLTDLVGSQRHPLTGGPEYRFPVRPQQIVTLRFGTDSTVPAVKPLTRWDDLVPEGKRAALNRYLPEVKGHPPAGR